MEDNKLYHHGVKGMQWGVRRYQRKDGSLTPLGEKHASKLNASKTAEELKAKRAKRKLEEQKAKHDIKEDKLDRANARKIASKKANAEVKAIKSKKSDEDLYDVPDDSAENERRISTGKAIAAGVLAAAGTALAIYAIKKFRDNKTESNKTTETVDNIVKEVGDSPITLTRKDFNAQKREIKAKQKQQKKEVDKTLNETDDILKRISAQNDSSYNRILELNKAPSKKDYKSFEKQFVKEYKGRASTKELKKRASEKWDIKNTFRQNSPDKRYPYWWELTPNKKK